MRNNTLTTRQAAEIAMRDALGATVQDLEQSLRGAGLHSLDEDELSQLYVSVLEGRDPQKAVGDITRGRRFDSSTRTGHRTMLSISQLAEDDPAADISTEHIAAGHYLAQGDDEYTPRNAALGDSARFRLVRSLARLSEAVSTDQLLAAASALNENGAWEQRRDATGRLVGRKFTTSWRLRELRAGLDLSLDQLPGIIQAADSIGLREAALRALSCAQAISEHYLGWFGEEIAEALASVDSLLEAAETELQAMHEQAKAAEVGEREGEDASTVLEAAEDASALEDDDAAGEILEVLEPIQVPRWAQVRQLRQHVRVMRCQPSRRGLWRRALRHRAAAGEKPGGASDATTPGRGAAPPVFSQPRSISLATLAIAA